MFNFLKERKRKSYKKLSSKILQDNEKIRRRFLFALEYANKIELENIQNETICHCLSNSGINAMKKLGMNKEIEKCIKSEKELLDLHRKLGEKLEEIKKDEETKKIINALKKMGY